MSKAEERALEVYPSTSHYWNSEPDRNASAREYYKQGYSQAEKDNALTWKDLKLLQDITHEVFAQVANGSVDYYQIYPTEQSFLEEVLKRFKERKDK